MSAKHIGLLLTLLFTLLLTATAVLAQETPPPAPNGEVDDVAAGIVDLTVEAAESTAITLDNFLDRLVTVPQSPLMQILFIIGGIILLVAGWRVYDFIVVIAGFLIGASIGISLVGPTENTLLLVAALLIGGLIGAVLGIFLYYVAVFVIGAYIGILITGALASALTVTPVSPVVLLIGGLIGGLVLIGLSFEFLVLLSSLVGAQLITLALGLNPLWTLVLAVIGVIIQLVLVRSFNYDFRRRRRVRWFRRSA